MSKTFSIDKPKNPLPLVFDSPHSGTVYPDDFDYVCEFEDLECAEDKFIEDIFACAPEYGGALLQAHFPRSYIDPNRAADDLDVKIIADTWPFGELRPTARSDAGIGLIRRLVKPGVPLYGRKLRSDEIKHRIDTYYTPYHDALEKLIEETHYNFGQVWHINCHSMPSSSAVPKQPTGLIGNAAKASDFVLGDRDGTSCDPAFTQALRSFIQSLGYTVTLNDPFKGVELVQRYSNPSRGRHSIQIEINKALYMDEGTNEKHEGYKRLKSDVERLVQFCADYVEGLMIPKAAD